MTNNIVAFDLECDTEPTFRRAVGYYETSTAGAYGDDAYYVAASQMIGSIEVAKELVRVDLEAGTYKTVGELTGYTNLINDMTYDRSAAKMYAISRIDDTRSALFTIDLKTAESSLVANLDRKFFTLAADYSGNLFAISFDGDLCSIDKTTGKVRVIGSTGQHPEKFQSMEFDHATRTLWWIATTRSLNESGTIELSECFVAKVNTSTGAITRCNDFGDNQIAGLYIPAFAAPDNCPAPVESPQAVAADKGDMRAVLSWTNPSETFGGEPLKTISKIEIKRDGVIVGNVTDAEPGKRSSFTDVIDDVTGATHTWLITAYNNNGAGAAAAVSAFVGRDIPAPATGITVERLTPNSARISWEPASAGVNGGWCDPESFTYTVVRYPDEKVIASDISDTECNDSGAEVSDTYYYAITTTSSCVTFMMRSGGAAVTGFVTDSGNNPVEGAEVAIPEIRASTKSGADGSFRFDFVPNGESSIQAKMFGYKDSEATKITVSDKDASTTIRIEKLPVYTVSGRVLAPDGNPVEKADIALAGYADLTTTSNTDGTFPFSDVVVSDETTVTVSKDRYVDYSETFNLNADRNMGDITLGYAHFAPAGITVAASDGAASLTWDSPSAETDFIYDSGKADTQIGFSESIGTIVIGTAFRTPMTLNSISWFTTSEGGPHNSVNVYIYDLDEEGNPTGTMLYSERAVRNTDGQWTELTLENPVDAPRGCFVALNYPGFHGIGVDGDHKAFPFRENTYAFSTDYSSGDFAYFDSETLSGNLMIRAAGNAWSAEGMKPAASDAPEICTYNVWRASGYGSDDWTSLNSSPLTTTSFSDATWQNAPAGVYRYADASRTFAEADFDFPGRTQPCSFMVFNPSMTTPSMADQRSASIPYEGDAELASFAGYSGSDDWFISPRLTYHNDFTLKFMARGYSRTYGELIRVGYSTTDTDPMSFTWIADRVDVPMQVWTEFEYTVPAAARYVAINCISPDGFTLFIDNVEISSGNGFEMNTAVSGPEVIYAVSLDGEELARTTDCSFMLSNVAKGAHTAEVKAVYASGESAPATVRFGETGLNGLNGSEISVWPNPAPGYTIVRGDFSRATIYDLSGRSLRTFDGTEKRLDLSGFAHGIYLLAIETEDNRTTTIKLAVR